MRILGADVRVVYGRASNCEVERRLRRAAEPAESARGNDVAQPLVARSEMPADLSLSSDRAVSPARATLTPSRFIGCKGRRDATAGHGERRDAVSPAAAQIRRPPNPHRGVPPAYAWAQLLARIYEVLPLLCPLCAAPMQIVAFIIASATVRAILAHLGEPIRPPIIAPARAPPLDLPDAACKHFDPQAQPAPAYEFDQRIAYGIPLVEGPVARTDELGPIRSVCFRDPDGNLVEVSEYPGVGAEGAASG